MVNALDSHPYAGYMPPQHKDEPGNNGFPQRLSTLRKERSLTQQALAEMAGLGITQIKRYEAGASQHTLDVIRKLSQVLRVSADELLFGKAERGPDEDLRLQFEAISRFNDDEKKSSNPCSKVCC